MSKPVRGRPSRLLGSFGRGDNFRRRPQKPGRAKLDPRAAAAIRVRLVASLIAGLAALVLARAWQLQIVTGSRYDDAARRQAETSARITAKRGVIKDRNGAELAISVDVDSIFAEPRRIAEPAAAAARLAPILGLDRNKLARRLGSDRPFVYLKRKVGPEVAEKVRALGLAGIGVRAEPRRFYPSRDLAAHVLGFVDGEGEGKSGIERTFDQVLRGKSYLVPGLRDALGNRAFVEGFVPQAALEGDDLVLTIDRVVQHAAEVELAKAIEAHRASAGAVVVLEPASGDVLALASWPTFNPNNLRGSGPQQHLNRTVSAVYEPGSTLKLVTIAAALEERSIASSDRIDCENGRWTVGGRTIGDAQHRYGVLSISEVMKHSSNICAAKIGLGLGAPRLHRWLRSFGFGAPTGVELPGELPGLLREPSGWQPIDLANIAFGQGLSATPLQIAHAASVIANQGLSVPPRLIKARVDKAGTVTPVPRGERRRVLSAESARAVRSMLTEVTQKGGTAEAAAIPGMVVAGKTGTAQKIDPVSRAYSRSLYTASFVGFVPAEDPAVLVLVLIDEPKGSIYGGQVAAPAFKQIALAALSARSVYPEGAGPEPLLAVLPEAVSADPDLHLDPALSPRAQALLGMDPVGVTAGPRAFEHQLSPAELDVERPALPGKPGRMPNFAGLRVREVLNRSAEVHCDLVLRGTGRVVRQTPPAGAALPKGARCEVELAPSG